MHATTHPTPPKLPTYHRRDGLQHLQLLLGGPVQRRIVGVLEKEVPCLEPQQLTLQLGLQLWLVIGWLLGGD